MFLHKDHHPGTVAVTLLILEQVTACQYYPDLERVTACRYCPEFGEPADISEALTIESLAVDLSNIAKNWARASELAVTVDHGHVNRMETKVNSLVQHAEFNPSSNHTPSTSFISMTYVSNC